MGRPSFNEAWSAFGKVNFPVADVGRIIGGNVGQNISGGYFENACPIRMSYVLNATGFPISRSSPYATVREGANKRGNSSRLTQSFHFFMFEPIFSPVNALNQPI